MFYNVCTDKILNLDSLLVQVKAEVTSQWYQLGEALGVNKATLEKCSQYPPEESIVEILDNWLRNHLGQPTWREVAETLKTIGFQQLGCDIENVYKTGITNDCFPSYCKYLYMLQFMAVTITIWSTFIILMQVSYL